MWNCERLYRIVLFFSLTKTNFFRLTSKIIGASKILEGLAYLQIDYRASYNGF